MTLPIRYYLIYRYRTNLNDTSHHYDHYDGTFLSCARMTSRRSDVMMFRYLFILLWDFDEIRRVLFLRDITLFPGFPEWFWTSYWTGGVAVRLPSVISQRLYRPRRRLSVVSDRRVRRTVSFRDSWFWKLKCWVKHADYWYFSRSFTYISVRLVNCIKNLTLNYSFTKYLLVNACSIGYSPAIKL